MKAKRDSMRIWLICIKTRILTLVCTGLTICKRVVPWALFLICLKLRNKIGTSKIEILVMNSSPIVPSFCLIQQECGSSNPIPYRLCISATFATLSETAMTVPPSCIIFLDLSGFESIALTPIVKNTISRLSNYSRKTCNEPETWQYDSSTSTLF